MAIASLYNWKAYATADGTAYYPPEGSIVAGVYVRERIRPLEPVKQIIRQAREQLSASVSIKSVSAIEPIDTEEGEYGAIVNISGTGHDHGRPIEYTTGLVFGDDFYDRIDAYFAESTKVEEYRALARKYILSYRLNLGELRARRFQYTPPPGWQGRARNLLAQWFPYDFPKRLSHILIPAAFPSSRAEASATARLLLQRRLAGFHTDSSTLVPLKLQTDVEAHLHHATGHFIKEESAVTELVTAVLNDHRHVYVARLETTREWLDGDRELLLDVARSIRPLGRPLSDAYKVMSWMVE